MVGQATPSLHASHAAGDTCLDGAAGLTRAGRTSVPGPSAGRSGSGGRWAASQAATAAGWEREAGRERQKERRAILACLAALLRSACRLCVSACASG